MDRKDAEREQAVVISEAEPTVTESTDDAVARVLERVDLRAVEAPSGASVTSAGPRLRTARIARVERGRVHLRLRGRGGEVEADVDDDVDLELLRRAEQNGDAVLVEEEHGVAPVVVGVVQTRLPDTLELRARKVVVEGEEEVLIRSGTGALRIRQDGDVELVGSRIMTMSRGLFRLVGRMLRLN